MSGETEHTLIKKNAHLKHQGPELRKVASSASMLEELIEEDSGTILGLIHLLDITNRNYGSMR